MTSMTSPTSRVVVGGIDTHGQTHHAAVIDEVGRQLGDREFTASPAGYRALAAWLGAHGTLTTVGVEGTGTYGAGLTRYLRSIGLTVVEVDRPDRKSRRAHGKSDPLDAYAAARAVLSGSATGVPKLRDGRVEAIRALRVARSSAVKARSQATNQIKALIISAPAELREQAAPPTHPQDHRQLRPVASRPPARRPRPSHQDRAAPTRPTPPTLERRDQRRRPRHRPAGRRRRTRTARRARCRPPSRRPAPHQRRRQPRPDHLRSKVRPPLRGRSRPGQQRPDPPTPTQPEAVTAKPTTPSTSSSSTGSATTNAAAPTPNAAPKKDSPNPRSSDASLGKYRYCGQVMGLAVAPRSCWGMASLPSRCDGQF